MKKIVIITARKDGVIADITGILSERGINIRTLEAQKYAEHSTLILTTDQYEESMEALANTEYNAIGEETLVVRLEDVPGALAQVANRLQDADISIRGLHFVGRGEGHALAALAVEEPERAAGLLADLLVSGNETASSQD